MDKDVSPAKILEALETIDSGTAPADEKLWAVKDLWDYSCQTANSAVMIGNMALKKIIGLCNHETKSMRLVALHCLWNLSAYEENKGKVVEEGALPILLPIIQDPQNADRDTLNAVSAILQNVSESKFRSGNSNKHQVRIAQEGVVDAVVNLIKTIELLPGIQWRLCLLLANLTMHPQNIEKIKSAGALRLISEFIMRIGPELWQDDDSFASWLGLQPFVPLLQSPMLEVKLMAAFSLARFTTEKQYYAKFWRDVSLNGGIEPIFQLSKLAYRSEDENEVNIVDLIRKYSRMILFNLELEIDNEAVFIKESTMTKDYRQLFLSGKGADVHIIVDTHCIPCHKSILMARCEYFKARFDVTWDKSSATAPITDGIQVVKIDDLEYAAVRIAVEFIYCDFVQLSWENAVDVLEVSDRFGLDRLKHMCEDVIRQALDVESAERLLLLADRYSAKQLFQAALKFVAKNYAEVAQQPHSTIDVLPQHIKEQLTAMKNNNS
jgi:hypothetical protein